jgi:acyl dehydratase
MTNDVTTKPTIDAALEFERRLLTPGADLGVSDWIEVSQDMINSFGAAVQEYDPMHLDPEWVRANTSFDRPIAYGILTAALISRMFANALQIPSISYAPVSGRFLNYGFNRLRYVVPVPAGSRIRGHFRTASRQPEPSDGKRILVFDVLVELEGSLRPALVAEWLSAWMTA